MLTSAWGLVEQWSQPKRNMYICFFAAKKKFALEEEKGLRRGMAWFRSPLDMLHALRNDAQFVQTRSLG